MQNRSPTSRVELFSYWNPSGTKDSPPPRHRNWRKNCCWAIQKYLMWSEFSLSSVECFKRFCFTSRVFAFNNLWISFKLRCQKSQAWQIVLVSAHFWLWVATGKKKPAILLGAGSLYFGIFVTWKSGVESLWFCVAGWLTKSKSLGQEKLKTRVQTRRKSCQPVSKYWQDPLVQQAPVERRLLAGSKRM